MFVVGVMLFEHVHNRFSSAVVQIRCGSPQLNQARRIEGFAGIQPSTVAQIVFFQIGIEPWSMAGSASSGLEKLLAAFWTAPQKLYQLK